MTPPTALAAILIQDAAAPGRAQAYVRELLEAQRDAVDGANDDLFEVGDATDEAEAANEVFDAVDLEGAGADVEVRALDGHDQLLQGDAVGPHGIGVDVNLIFLDMTADGGDLGDAADGLKGVAEVPILNTTQLLQVPAAAGLALFIAALEGVPEDLAEAGGVGAEGGAHGIREGAVWEAGEFFEDARAGPVEVNLFFEDDVDG